MLYSEYKKYDTLPIDDDKAIYNKDIHAYVLTKDYFEQRTGINLEEELDGDEKEAEVFLVDISESFYDIVYTFVNPRNRVNNIQVKEHTLALDNTVRDDLIRALLVYGRACINTDIDRVGDEHGFNFDKGTRIEIKEWDDLPLQTKRKMRNLNLFETMEYSYSVDPDEYRKDY